MSAADCRDQIQAQAQFVRLVAQVLDRADVLAATEFRELLGLFAVTVGEADPAQGRILAFWAASVEGDPH